MSQNPIIERKPPPHRSSKVGTNIPLVWRRLPDTESKLPPCLLLCPAINALIPIRWSSNALFVFFNVNSQSFIRDTLKSCQENTRLYLLTTPEQTDETKKFAKGLEPRLRTLIRTTQHAGPCSVFTAKLGVSWNTTKAGKTWRLQMNEEQCVAYHERFLYAFWHESSSQHHLAGDTWVTQTGQAIESPFNAPAPTNEKLSLLAEDEQGIPNKKIDYIVSRELGFNCSGNLILTDREIHSFAKLESLLVPGVRIKVNSHDIPMGYVSGKNVSALIMQYGSASYRLALSEEQTEELIKWIDSTDGWQFLRDVPQSTQPDYLNASFQLERGQDIIPGKEFPNGICEKSLGTFKATDFIDFFDDKLRITQLPDSPELAVLTDYTWKIKPPELDETSKKITEYNEWEKIIRAINSIKTALLRDFEELTKEINSALSSNINFKREQLGAAQIICQKSRTELDELDPEKNNWKYGLASTDFDPLKILYQRSEYYEETKALITNFTNYNMWTNEINLAKNEHKNLQTKIDDLLKEIEDCRIALESKDNLSNHKAIGGKKQSLESDLEKKKAACNEKKKASEVSAPASANPKKSRLDGRNDLVIPKNPLPIIGELFYSEKKDQYTLTIKYVEEIEPAKAEIIRLKKYYGQEIKLARKPD